MNHAHPGPLRFNRTTIRSRISWRGVRTRHLGDMLVVIVGACRMLGIDVLFWRLEIGCGLSWWCGWCHCHLVFVAFAADEEDPETGYGEEEDDADGDTDADAGFGTG